jgi:hypothetical protein
MKTRPLSYKIRNYVIFSVLQLFNLSQLQVFKCKYFVTILNFNSGGREAVLKISYIICQVQ